MYKIFAIILIVVFFSSVVVFLFYRDPSRFDRLERKERQYEYAEALLREAIKSVESLDDSEKKTQVLEHLRRAEDSLKLRKNKETQNLLIDACAAFVTLTEKGGFVDPNHEHPRKAIVDVMIKLGMSEGSVLLGVMQRVKYLHSK